MEQENLFQICKWRWLKPSEVFSILRRFGDISIPEITQFTTLPTNGDLFFVRKSKFKRWKQDGHSYISRKSGNGTREDRERYADEIDTIQCAYVHGSGMCNKCKMPAYGTCNSCGLPITPIKFHRRAYWLLKDPDIVLVHYLDEANSDWALDEESSNISSISSEASSLMNVEPTEQIKKIEEVLKHLDMSEIPCVSIIDFSPEWADIAGGSKILICIEPAIMVPQPHLLLCAFGDVKVHVESVQLGVLRCYTPVHDPGIVDLYLLYDNKEITNIRKEFEFKEIHITVQAVRVKDWWNQSTQDLSRELAMNLGEEYNLPIEPELENGFDEEFFLSEFSNIIRNDGVFNLNYKGRGILHYLAALNYSKCIRLIGNEKADLNKKSSDGKTPLQIAAYKNNKESILALLQLGAIIENPEDDKAGLFSALSRILSDFQNSPVDIESRVQLIQRHVRTWLFRKQFHDIRQAAKTLQRAIRGMLARKHFKYQKKAAVLIQKTVRSWLLSMHKNNVC